MPENSQQLTSETTEGNLLNSAELLYSRYSELDSTKSPERQFTNAGGLDETDANQHQVQYWLIQLWAIYILKLNRKQKGFQRPVSAILK
jgi:hypothetical protein